MVESLDARLLDFLSLSGSLWHWNPCCNLSLGDQREHTVVVNHSLFDGINGFFEGHLPVDQTEMA